MVHNGRHSQHEYININIRYKRTWVKIKIILITMPEIINPDIYYLTSQLMQIYQDRRGADQMIVTGCLGLTFIMTFCKRYLVNTLVLGTCHHMTCC